MDVGPQVLVVQPLDLAQRLRAKGRKGRGGRVLPGLRGTARAGDDRAHPRLLDRPAQRRLGGRRRAAVSCARIPGEGARSGRDGGELGRRPHASRVVHAGEGLAGVERLPVPVEGAVVVGGERGRQRVAAGQQTGRERDADDDAGPGRRGRGQHRVKRLAAERVEDDLDGGDARMGDRREGLVTGLDRDPVGGDAVLSHQRVERVVDGAGGEHRRRRAVQLDQVEAVDPEVGPRAVGPGTEVRQRVVLRLLIGPAAHLGGDHDGAARLLGQEPADDLLAAPVAVDVGGVEEGDAGLGRSPQHGQGVGLADRAPVGTELPGAEADNGHRPAGRAENALLHGERSYAVRPARLRPPAAARDPVSPRTWRKAVDHEIPDPRAALLPHDRLLD